MTKIQWADKTINPIVGCSKISEGCQNCYAATQAKSKRLTQFERYEKVKNWNGTLAYEPKVLRDLKRREKTRFFVGSMTDLFHDEVKTEWLKEIFQAFSTSQHEFMLLTKRPENMVLILNNHKQEFGYNNFYVNIWAGVSVENQAVCDRISYLALIQTAIRFISFEPLLEPIDLRNYDLSFIDWAIIGGESGTNARPCSIDWMRSLISQLRLQNPNIKIFVKQLGKESDYRTTTRKGDRFAEFPKDLQIREIPTFTIY